MEENGGSEDHFREVAHSGGQITFTYTEHGFQVGYRVERPTPTALFEIYALPNGTPVESVRMGGIGDPKPVPSVPGSVPVFIVSDSQGHFGHDCPRCGKYWRCGAMTTICPYCGLHARDVDFLSQAQRRYVKHYCEVLTTGMETAELTPVTIDMDAVSDAVAVAPDMRPSFYVSDESQQRKYVCRACEEFNDIIGRFGFCSRCGTRSDMAHFEEAEIPGIRTKLNGGAAPADCLRDAVSAFDTFVAQYLGQLASHVRMTPRRKAKLQKMRFHNVEEVRVMLADWFDIELSNGIADADFRLAVQKFHRRHVYEHNGGEVDEKYLRDSGDNSVRLKQAINETREDIHSLLGIILRMARNLHEGFHEVLPPRPEPVKAFADKKARMARSDAR